MVYPRTERKGTPNMRKIRIVADSSANLLGLETTQFAVAPLKIVTDSREFVDDDTLDAEEMVSWFASSPVL